MIIYVDENLPPAFVEGFEHLQRPLSKKLSLKKSVTLKSIEQVFGQGVRDEDWIPQVGEEEACVITQDFNIHRIRHQRELCEQYGLGMFYFRPPSRGGLPYWKMVELFVKHWPKILEIATNKRPPFSYEITSRRGPSRMN